MEIENEFTFQKTIHEGINLFFGSGFSVLANDADKRPLPRGNELAIELQKKFQLSASSDLQRIATILSRTHKAGLRTFLKQRFSVETFDSRYKSIQKINISKIFTTNIDDLLFKIFMDSPYFYINDLDIRGASFNDRTAIDLVTLHGCVLDDSRDFTFTSEDLAVAFRSDPDRWHFLTEAMQSHPTLFWGYSVRDAGTLQALHPGTIAGRSLRDTWILVPDDIDESDMQYYKALNFQLIRGDTSNLLDYIETHSPSYSDKGYTKSSIKDLFPEYRIPDPTKVAVRPLLDFFRGAPPSWYDIFAGRIHRTRHHARVRNSLSSGRDTIIVGVPACGKTTLLMQVMQEFEFHGHKLVCESLSVDKAQLLQRHLQGDRALIGIDNFADSVDAIIFLRKYQNIQILAADRSYNFDTIYHRIVDLPIDILDITDLESIDIEGILERIPVEVRSNTRRIPRMGEGVLPSIFEIVESNVKLPALKQRFRNVLLELRKQDEKLLELLLVCSYVHSCRTPISLDMLLSYFRGTVSDYNDIFSMRSRLGQLLTDYVGDLNDGLQDYYIPRSTIVSEAVVDQAQGEDLRKMILKFHGQISPFRIHRFDVFRRHAFDADIMARAFSDWNEGQKFYRDANNRDRTPYILQQGALYLAHKRQYIEAFSMIDEALIESNQRIPSIRNSHAIILFRANIDKEDADGTVEQTLERSMQILTDCYHEDRRKAYHVVTFTDQALKFDDRFGRNRSEGYLRTALAWLQQESKRAPWNRSVTRLIPVVERRIGK